jgi:DNA-binding beta-propeller fold protein YncE
MHKDRLKSIGFIPAGSTGANGLALLKDEKTLVIGVGDAGVAFLNVKDAIRGTAKPYFASQGDGAGTFDVVASSDGKVVFSSNEYGALNGQRGSVGVIAVNADVLGRVTHPQTLRRISVGDVVPSLTLSPDGSRLYVATELVPSKEPPLIAGASNPALTKNDCVQKKGTPPRSNGFITVIDTQRAVELDSNAILSRVAAGCSPVRLVETADSSTLFVSARGDDAILSFSPHLLELDPEHALLRVLPSGGTAPVGMRLFAQDRMLAVANSNRFADSDGTVAVLDVSSPVDHAPLKTWTAGAFPRNIGISRDGKTLYLTNYTSRSLQVVHTVVR